MNYRAASAAIRERRRQDIALAKRRAKRDLQIIRAKRANPQLTGPELAAMFGVSKGWVHRVLHPERQERYLAAQREYLAERRRLKAA